MQCATGNFGRQCSIPGATGRWEAIWRQLSCTPAEVHNPLPGQCGPSPRPGPSGPDHQHAIHGNDAGVPAPFLAGFQCAEHQRGNVHRNRRMDAKQNHAAPFQRLAALDCDLPEVLVEGQQDPAIYFSEIQECGVARAGSAGAHPHHIVARLPQCLHGRQRKFSSASRRIKRGGDMPCTRGRDGWHTPGRPGRPRATGQDSSPRRRLPIVRPQASPG